MPHPVLQFTTLVAIVYTIFVYTKVQEHSTIETCLPPTFDAAHTPLQWLQDNTYRHVHALLISTFDHLCVDKPKGVFMVLVHNTEEAGMIHSILQVEAILNSRKTHCYDWVMFNNEPFTPSFTTAVVNATASQLFFEQIQEEHWKFPDWADRSPYQAGREFQGGIGAGKAHLKSYYLMCCWYWRVEPGIQYTCNINYDGFRFTHDNEIVSGFNMVAVDDARSFPCLWELPQAFKKHNPQIVHKEADMRWILHNTNELSSIIRSGTGYQSIVDGQYHKCQLYFNFEIGSLGFFRSKENQPYFQRCDQSGSFFYVSFSDASVHTHNVMFLPKRRVWFFRDTGYCQSHVSKNPIGPEPDPRRIKNEELRKVMEERDQRIKYVTKDLERQKTIPGLACGCTTTNFDTDYSKLVPYKSKHVKPAHSCIRLWLGNGRLKKDSGNYLIRV